MVKWLFIFLGAVVLIAVLILIGLMVAMVEEICRKGVIDRTKYFCSVRNW